MAAELDSGLMEFPSLLETVKGCDAEQLVEIMSTASAALKKFVKSMGVRKVNPANPVGVMPAALMKNGAWVDCVLERAQREGWEAFVVQTKSKKTGTVVAEQMAESGVGENGVHVFSDTGKAFTRKHAMVYGKFLKDSSSDWYSEFERSYVSDSPVAPKSAKAVASVVPKSSAEVAAEAVLKKALAAEKRKATLQAKKAEKVEEAAKAAANALPAGTVRLVRVQTPPPAARAVATPPPAMVATVATPMASVPKASVAKALVAKPTPKKPAVAAKVTEEWEPISEGYKEWTFKGVRYIRLCNDAMYTIVVKEDGERNLGDYVGLMVGDKLDKSVEEPAAPAGLGDAEEDADAEEVVMDDE